MAALILALAVASAPPAVGAPVAGWQPLIDGAARRFAIPNDWVARVMTAESDGATTLSGLPIRSRAGAMGLMQLMPGTWADLRVAYKLGSDPDDPADNITAGTAYLRQLYDRFGYPGLFAAYNAGPGRYADYLAGHAGLPIETRAYLAKITGTTTSPSIWSPATVTIFVLRHDRDNSNPLVERAQPAPLFAIDKAPR
ncbi:lytic transglycosylase domain-containing protein [Sphingomonas oryzagri]